MKIARKIVALAKALGVPCANIRNSDGAGLRVRVRKYDGQIPFPTPNAKVFVDHSAVHERGSVRESAVRSVPVAT